MSSSQAALWWDMVNRERNILALAPPLIPKIHLKNGDPQGGARFPLSTVSLQLEAVHEASRHWARFLASVCCQLQERLRNALKTIGLNCIELHCLPLPLSTTQSKSCSATNAWMQCRTAKHGPSGWHCMQVCLVALTATR